MLGAESELCFLFHFSIHSSWANYGSFSYCDFLAMFMSLVGQVTPVIILSEPFFLEDTYIFFSDEFSAIC